MTTGLGDPPDAAAAPAVREVLDRHGFATAHQQLLGTTPTVHRLAALLAALPAAPVACLLTLLALGQSVPADEVAAGLSAAELDLLLGSRLVEDADGVLRPRVRLTCWEGLVVAGDHPNQGTDPSFVAPVSGTTRLAAALCSQAGGDLGLDLCTGSGALALLLSRTVRRVVATDVAPRALGYAAFNAGLAGVELDLRAGAFFDPVDGERFDVVVSNPPFVVGPGDGLVYRDAGLAADGVSELVVRGIAGHLAPGGRGTTTLAWVGDDPARPLSWAGDVGTAWLLRTAQRDPHEHASLWASEHLSLGEQRAELARWTDAVRGLSEVGVGEGAMVLAATSGRRTRRCDDLARLPAQLHGDAVDEAVTARAATPADLADVRLGLLDGSRLVEEQGPAGTVWSARRLGGLLLDLELSPALAAAAAEVTHGSARAALTRIAQVQLLDHRDPQVLAELADAVVGLVDAGVLGPTARAPAAVALPAQLPPPPDPSRAAAVSAALRDAGYDAAGIAAVLGTTGGPLLVDEERPVYERRVEAVGLGALVRLLLLELDVPESALAAVGPVLLDAGVAVRAGDCLRAAATIVPHGPLLIASDLVRHREHPDVVPGAQRPSSTLADLTPRGHVARALDLGTGCGIQALLLARHSDEVVASDVSARALDFAAFNAAAAGVVLDLRHGPWFEPVADERFDLVVANPPYVVSPGRRWTFRDSGLPADGASELVCRALPQHLADDGVGVVLVSWVPDGGAPSPLRWSALQGCEALLLATAEHDALTTAAGWNRELRGDPDAYAAALDEWLAWTSAEGITATAYGALVLRRTGGARARSLPLPDGVGGPAADQLLRLLQPVPDDAVERAWRLAPDVVLDLHAVAGGAGAARAVVRQVSGLRLQCDLSQSLVALVAGLDGRTPLPVAAAAAGVDPALAWEELRHLASLGLVEGVG